MATQSLPVGSSSKSSGLFSALQRPEFADSERLAFLYANILPLKERNPASYKTIIAWWHQLLLEIVPEASEDKLVLHASDRLATSLATESSGRPLSLGCVLQELSSGPKEALIRLEEFLTSAAPLSQRHRQSWPFWVASNAVSRPLWWALKQLSIVEESQNQASSHAAALWDKYKGDWVAVELVEHEAQRVLEDHQPQKLSTVECLHSLESFRTEICPHLSLTDLKVLLKFLSRDERILIYDLEANVVKWLTSGLGQEAQITESDRGIVQLKSARISLEEQIAQLESRIETLQEQIADFVRRKHMDRAKLSLRHKKTLQDLLLKRQGSLATLESVWLGIEKATGDAQILRAYETATATLRGVLNAPELQNVEQTMDKLADTLADQKDIEEAIDIEHAPTSEADESELLQELDQLASNQQRTTNEETEHREQLPEMPSAPNSALSDKAEKAIQEAQHRQALTS